MARPSLSHSRVVSLATMAAGLGLAWIVRRAARTTKRDAHAAAFCDCETDRENIDQTRSAGSEAMRDPARRSWEPIDQALDESFPASDPPAY